MLLMVGDGGRKVGGPPSRRLEVVVGEELVTQDSAHTRKKVEMS